MLYLIYYLVYLLFLTFLIYSEYRKRPPKLRRLWLSQRLGGLTIEPDDRQKTVWFHAVSVGEVISTIPLIKKLIETMPVRLILSVTTDTGREIALKNLEGIGITVTYLPFDLPFIIKRALSKARPSVLIIMETEIWPGLVSSANDMGIPVMLLNGRISERSFSRYMLFRFFFKNTLNGIEFFGMQGKRYADRIIEMGAPQERVSVIGSLKFDAVRPAHIPEWSSWLNRPLIIAGSTHPGEEVIVLRAFIELKVKFRGLTLIIAPRHPSRFGEAAGITQSMGLRCIERSTISPDDKDRDVVILDTIGELSAVYGACDICIIGGSFVPIGGHNLLEPASYSRAIICGRHMENFPMTQDFIENNGVIITDEGHLSERIEELLINREFRTELGRNAGRIFEKNSGTLNRSIKEIMMIIDKDRPFSK